MPLYEYQCQACGQRFEVIQKFSDPPPETCAKCGKGPVERLLSSPAIQFKGTGWYITDYAKKSTTEPAPKTGTSSEAKSDSGSSDTSTKSESTSTPAPATKPSST
jgi:putative FmdB family regulatory protein